MRSSRRCSSAGRAATARGDSVERLSLHSRKSRGSAAERNTHRCHPRASARAASASTAATYSDSPPGPTLTRETVSVRAILDSAFRELLKLFLHIRHEAVGVGAIHDAMIECQREQATRPNREGVGAIHRNDGRLLLD